MALFGSRLRKITLARNGGRSPEGRGSSVRDPKPTVPSAQDDQFSSELAEQRQSSTGVERLARHIRRIVGGQECEHGRHLLRRACTAHGNVAFDVRPRLLVILPGCIDVGDDGSRGDRIHPDVAIGVFQGQRPRQVPEAALADRVGDEPRFRNDLVDARAVEDRTSTRPREKRLIATCEQIRGPVRSTSRMRRYSSTG